MYDTLVSSSVLFSTLILFFTFVALSVLFLGTLNNPDAKWFFVPLLGFMAFSLLKSINNIHETIKIKEASVKIQTAAVVLNTCPDYWIKDTVFVDDPTLDSDAEPIRLDICKNYSENKEGTVQFVGGSQMADNFATNAGKSIDEMNKNYTEKLKKAVETFTDAEQPYTGEPIGDYQIRDVGERDEGQHSIGKLQVPKHASDRYGKSVLFDGLNPNQTDATKLTELDGGHLHILATHPNAYNVDGVHSDINGLVYHTHEFERPKEQIPAEQKRDGEFKENWINVSKEPHKGLEINLTKLNKAESVCELTSPFYWTERYNKCLQK